MNLWDFSVHQNRPHPFYNSHSTPPALPALWPSQLLDPDTSPLAASDARPRTVDFYLSLSLNGILPLFLSLLVRNPTKWDRTHLPSPQQEGRATLTQLSRPGSPLSLSVLFFPFCHFSLDNIFSLSKPQSKKLYTDL